MYIVVELITGIPSLMFKNMCVLILFKFTQTSRKRERERERKVFLDSVPKYETCPSLG